ncbi:hypothetical protein QYF36_010967 [Acer negundo]|nr:hypothetical protein QYF36_010967 [Acer negundo]
MWNGSGSRRLWMSQGLGKVEDDDDKMWDEWFDGKDLVQKAASLQEEHRLTKERWAKAKRDMAELEKAVTWLTKDKRDSNVGASKAKKEQDRI